MPYQQQWLYSWQNQQCLKFNKTIMIIILFQYIVYNTLTILFKKINIQKYAYILKITIAIITIILKKFKNDSRKNFFLLC